jgi:hypothetical protein
MSDSHSPEQWPRPFLLSGMIYAIVLNIMISGAALFALAFYASDHMDAWGYGTKPALPLSTRLKRAWAFFCDFGPTRKTRTIVQAISYFHLVAYTLVALFQPYSMASVSWAGFVLMDQMLAIAIALTVAFVVVRRWLRRVGVGQTRPQACYLCFTRDEVPLRFGLLW